MCAICNLYKLTLAGPAERAKRCTCSVCLYFGNSLHVICKVIILEKMLLPIHNDCAIWPNASARDQFSVEANPLHVHMYLGEIAVITTIIIFA